MQNVGTLQDISIDYKTNKLKITLLLEQRQSISSLEEIKKDKLSIEIKNIVNLVVSTQINTFGNYFKRFAIIKT